MKNKTETTGGFLSRVVPPYVVMSFAALAVLSTVSCSEHQEVVTVNALPLIEQSAQRSPILSNYVNANFKEQLNRLRVNKVVFEHFDDSVMQACFKVAAIPDVCMNMHLEGILPHEDILTMTVNKGNWSVNIESLAKQKYNFDRLMGVSIHVLQTLTVQTAVDVTTRQMNVDTWQDK
jgi:hypothetical protein